MEDTVKTSSLGGLGRGRALVAAAAGMLAAATLIAAGASAHAATNNSEVACSAHGTATTHGHRIGGIIHALKPGCQVHKTSDPANGAPPLIWHNGNVMGTPGSGPVTVTPIYWHPAGHSMTNSYQIIINGYLRGVAAASGTHTNVFSTLSDYSDSSGHIAYNVTLGTPISDTNPLPANGCSVAGNDKTKIYADGTGYNACLDDNQIIAETENVVNANHLPVDLGHMYVLFLPKHVESCFNAGSTTSGGNQCTINHHKSATYCAYHSMAPNGMVYGNLPYPIYSSPAGFTCSSDARFPTVQSPNGNPDADTEVSPTSHEIMEAITDPDTATGWYDVAGFENGDECAYVFGPTQGTAGALYNQVIGGKHYLTQEEFSNNDFADTGAGCLQSE
jgi:hypothetical protein